MGDLIASLAVIFGGVIGAAIGFLLIAATAVFLALPYWLMTRPSQEGRTTDRDAVPSGRY